MQEKYFYLVVSILITVVIVYLFLKQRYSTKMATYQAEEQYLLKKISTLEQQVLQLKEENNSQITQVESYKKTVIQQDAQMRQMQNEIISRQETIKTLQADYQGQTKEYNLLQTQLAHVNAENHSLEEKLLHQKEEVTELRKQLTTEFENIAHKILAENTKSFSATNEEKIKQLLTPLNNDIKAFKQKVEEVYDKEAKERFSLGERVKELAEKSEQISQDAINLTNALKGEVKTQGRWGEMILERILEKSGLRKGEEYFMEAQLYHDNGQALRSELAGKKMRPDVLIKYPDNRNVIIDSKVSLTAFTRYFEATTPEEQALALEQHVKSIKNHIIGLSAKGYEEYDKALDFVLMFIPTEPAYIAALQADPNLWNFAYDKRVLLMNPTNLITALKLIVDLWKREYQNQNAIKIANRGEKLYKKFVGFVENMEKVGDSLEKAQSSYQDAYKQLSTGKDNLVRQATKLKELGNFQPKKDLNEELLNQYDNYLDTSL